MDDLTQALTRLAEAIERQAQSIDALIQALSPEDLNEAEDAAPATYLDGTPIER